MGFTFRKSVRVGPMRVNLSKSGVGVSTGIPGARISVGPRGTYLHLGRGGVYYRQRLDRSPSAPPPATPLPHGPRWAAPNSGDSDLVRGINERAHRPAYAPVVLAGTVVFALIVASSARLGGLAWAVLLLGLGLCWWTRSRDARRRTSVLVYDLDDSAASLFAGARAAFGVLREAQRVWVMTSSLATYDWKRNAGAGNLVERRPGRVGPVRLPYVEANVPVEGIEAGKLRLAFLPDVLLVHDGRTYGAISYEELIATVSTVDFREGDPVPSDAQVIGHTWLYVRRDGGPDRRFNANRQIPIVLYGTVSLGGLSGEPVVVYVSRTAVADRFAASVRAVQGAAVAASVATARARDHDAEPQTTARPWRPMNPPPPDVVVPSPPVSRPAPSSANGSGAAISPEPPAVDWTDRSAGIAEPCSACGRRVLLTVGDVLDGRTVACWRCSTPVDLARLRPTGQQAPSEPPAPTRAPVATRPTTPARTDGAADHRARWAWFCGGCGARNPAGDTPCTTCSARGGPAGSSECAFCGALLPAGASYCQGCGRATPAS